MENEETVTISLVEYKRLLEQADLLEWLETTGVDNWSGYSTPPVRDDYDTEEEYQKVYERKLYGWD